MRNQHKDGNYKVLHKTKQDFYRCDHCPRRFQLRRQLSMHIRSRHDDSMYFECPKCGKGFRTGILMGYHVRKCGYSENPVPARRGVAEVDDGQESDGIVNEEYLVIEEVI
jgi:uncharacterized Zn-finger protein